MRYSNTWIPAYAVMAILYGKVTLDRVDRSGSTFPPESVDLVRRLQILAIAKHHNRFTFHRN